MSCCGGSVGRYEFPPGPPLVEEPVAHLEARWLFMPFGTQFRQGDMVRLWMPNGRTRTVFVAAVMPVDYSGYPPRIVGKRPPTWAQVAHDSDRDEVDLIDWMRHPLHDPDQPPRVLAFEQIVVRERTLWARWRNLLARIRSL